MIRVDNRKVLNDIAGMTYRANKKRNIFTIAAIFLTTFLICTVISIGICYWDSLATRQQRMEGMQYDIELTEPREDQIVAVREMDTVKYAGASRKMCSTVYVSEKSIR